MLTSSTATDSTPTIPQALRGLLQEALEARARFKGYVIELYDQGHSMYDIGESCGIDEDTVLLWRREENRVRAYIPKGSSLLDQHAAELKVAWYAGELLRVLAERYGTTEARISTFAKKQGWPRRTPRTSEERGLRLDHSANHESMRELFEAGMSSAEIARRFDTTSHVVRRLARIQAWQRPPALLEEERESLVYQLLQQGLSIRGIYRNTGINRRTLKAILHRRGWEVLPGASDERAGAVPRFEEAVRSKGIAPRHAPKQAPPSDMPAPIQREREKLKELAMHLRRHGLRSAHICALCGVTAPTLTIWQREEGVHKVLAPKGHRWMEDHEEELKAAWLSDDDLSINALAKRLKLTRWHLQEMAARRGWPQRSQGPKKDSPVHRFVLPYHHEEVRALWCAGQSTRAIGARFGVGGAAVGSYAQRHSFPVRPKPSDLYEERVFQHFMDGLSLYAIAGELDLSLSRVIRLVRDRGWKRPRRART